MEITKVSQLMLKIPGDVVDALRLPPDEVDAELRKELALALYRRGVLSSGKACRLAGMTRWEFEELLGQRRIPPPPSFHPHNHIYIHFNS